MMSEFKKIILPEGEHPNPEKKEQEVRRATNIVEIIRSMQEKEQKIGYGERADVYAGLPELEDEGVCVKHIARPTRKAMYENSLEEEMELHAKARGILNQAQEGGTNVVKIPAPVAYVKTNENEEYFIMERIWGKTLYRLMLEQIAFTMPEEYFLPGMTREDIRSVSDEDLNQAIVWNYWRGKEKTEKELWKKIEEYFEEKPFLPTDIFVQIRNSLQVLNKDSFFHRDLHLKNIMISEDFGQVYFIDFGSSSYKEFTDQNDAYDVEKFGEKLLYTRDTSILVIVRKLTKKQT